jgi:hypothetical protein
MLQVSLRRPVLVLAGCLMPILLTGCPTPFTASDQAEDTLDAATDQGDTAADPDDGRSRPLPDTAAETVTPAGCDPACPMWQVCVDETCEPASCQTDAQCNPVPAIDPPHYCYRGKCQLFQCSDKSDCKPGDDCNKLTYLCYSPGTGCQTNPSACEDGDPCTLNTCNYASGVCEVTNVSNCCATSAQCDDKVACTVDTCVGQKCVNEPVGDCCSSDLECGDGKPCTTDKCSNGQCVFTPVANCCANDGNCMDSLDITVDTCVAQKCVHAWPGMTTNCTGEGQCQQTTCVASSCVSGKCSYSPIPTATGCCEADDQCQTDAKCFVPACQGGVCMQSSVSGVGPHQRYRFDTAALNGWTVEKSSQSVYFHFSTLGSVAGAGSLRYGKPGVISFEDSTANKGSATSPVLTVPTGAPSIAFWVALDAEPGTAVHQVGLDVIDVATGAIKVGLWNKNDNLKGSTMGAWKDQLVSLAPWAGKQVKLRFWFDQVKYDTSNKSKLGFVVDEIEIQGSCP